MSLAGNAVVLEKRIDHYDGDTLDHVWLTISPSWCWSLKKPEQCLHSVEITLEHSSHPTASNGTSELNTVRGTCWSHHCYTELGAEEDAYLTVRLRTTLRIDLLFDFSPKKPHHLRANDSSSCTIRCLLRCTRASQPGELTLYFRPPLSSHPARSNVWFGKSPILCGRLKDYVHSLYCLHKYPQFLKSISIQAFMLFAMVLCCIHWK